MSSEKAAGGQHKPHILAKKVYLGVWLGLLLLTVITVQASYVDFGIMSLVVAMGIATLKATLVVLFFMHLKYDEPFNVIVFVGSLAFLAVFFMFTLADTVERGKVDPLERGVIVPVPSRPATGDGRGVEGAHGETGTPVDESGSEETGTPGGS